jgi:DNA-binding SARP family transcriptional activator/tetratricopeptide (TPR) repeat protein/GTPase SAR1 family protein
LTLRLRTLGSLSLEADAPSPLAGRRKLLSLLAYLARHEGVLVRRAYLAELMWPEADEPRARQSLRQTLTELRNILGGGLGVTDRQIWLEPGSLWLDANAFTLAVGERRYQEALALWSGDFLPEAESIGGEEFRGWLEATREELRRGLALSCDAETERLKSQGAWPEASALARQWTVWAPHDERAMIRLVEVLILAGRRTEAAAEHAAGIHRLSEIGVPPTPQFSALATATAKPTTQAMAGVLALLSPDMIGRTDALIALETAWKRTAGGESATLLVTGETGSGKSRLLEEFVRSVRRENQVVLCHTRAFEAESDTPHALLRHLFAPLARAPGLAGCPAPVLKTLADWIPEIAEAFPQLPPEGHAAGSEAITRALADVGEDVPILVAVDDAHLADTESGEILKGLCRRPPRRTLVVLTLSPGAAGNFAGTRITLSNLDLAGTERLIASMAEFRPDDRRLLASLLFKESAGNPLAIVEIVRALAEAGAIGPGGDGTWTAGNLKEGVPLPVPVSLREAALARIQGLSADARSVLEASVVVGRELDPDMLLSLTGLGTARLEQALDDLISRRLLRASADGSARLEFAHDHLRRGVYESLSPLRRASWHRKAFQVLKRRAGRDSFSTAILSHHQARAQGGRKTRAWIAAVAAVLLVTIAVGWMLQRGAEPGAPRATVVRVMTFPVEGDSALGFLGRAVAELVAYGIDGSAGLVATVDSGPSDLFVTGRVVTANGELSIHAELHDAGTPARLLLQAVARGTVPDAVSVAREIARQLLRDRASGAVASPGALAWVNTRSIEALREYLEAERLFRGLEVPEAIQAFRRATRHDTTLAVGWYRIGESALWLLRSDVARVVAESALHYVTPADPNEVIHYRAFRDFARGDIAEAEAKLRGEIAVYPRRTECRYLLADLLYHFYWLKGVSSREARQLFLGLRRDQPGDWRPLFHLWDLAVAEGRPAEAAAIRDTIHALAPSADLFDGFDAIARFAAADSAGRRSLLDTLSQRDQWTLANTVRRYASLTGDPVGTWTLSGLLTAPERPPEVRATGHLFRSVAALGQGRFAEAKEEALRAEALNPTAAFQWSELILGQGLSGGSDLARERTRLSQSLVASGGIPLVPLAAPFYPWTDFDRRDAEDIFPYLRGRLALDRGDTADAGRWLTQLSDTPTQVGELRPVLAIGLQGALAGHGGDRRTAIRLLDSVLARRPVDHAIMSVFVARPAERYLLADWLEQEGRREEAISWLEGIGVGSIFDLAYLAPASFRLGETWEASGDRERAVQAYRRVVDLYRRADPEFQSLATRANERLRMLRN